jgi:hypothetical protein
MSEAMNGFSNACISSSTSFRADMACIVKAEVRSCLKPDVGCKAEHNVSTLRLVTLLALLTLKPFLDPHWHFFPCTNTCAVYAHCAIQYPQSCCCNTGLLVCPQPAVRGP